MKVQVIVKLKKDVLDVQGKAVEQTLHTMGFLDVSDVRQGKIVEFNLNCGTREEAEIKVKLICHQLLVNDVIENYQYNIQEK